MLKKSFVTLAGAGSLLLSSLALAQNSIPPPAKAEYRTAITLTNSASIEDLQLNLRAATLPPARTASPFAGFDFNTALIITGDPELNLSLAQWKLVSGTLPLGLTLSASGQLTGTPTEAATADIFLEVTYKGKTATGSYTIQASDGDVRIKQYPDARYYEDGTYAKDCLGYIEPKPGYLYEGATGDGIYRIQPGTSSFDVNCNMTYEGGGWTVFQRNTGAGDFNRTWAEYEAGFGALTEDHWIGLQRIHELMKEPQDLSLYVVNYGLGLPQGSVYVDKDYNLKGKYEYGEGTFTTWDNDRDLDPECNWAQRHKAGFWYPVIEPNCMWADLYPNYNNTTWSDEGFKLELIVKRGGTPPDIFLSVPDRILIEDGNGYFISHDLKPYFSVSFGDIDFSKLNLSLIEALPGLQIQDGILYGQMETPITATKLIASYGPDGEEMPVNLLFTPPETIVIPARNGVYFEYDFKKDVEYKEPIDFSQADFVIKNVVDTFTWYNDGNVVALPSDYVYLDNGVLNGAFLKEEKNIRFDLYIHYQGDTIVKKYDISVLDFPLLDGAVVGDNMNLSISNPALIPKFGLTPEFAQAVTEAPTFFSALGVNSEDIVWELDEALVQLDEGVRAPMYFPEEITYANNRFYGVPLRLDDTKEWGANRLSRIDAEANTITVGYVAELVFKANVNGRTEKRKAEVSFYENFGVERQIRGTPYSFDLNPHLLKFFPELNGVLPGGVVVDWECNRLACPNGILLADNVPEDNPSSYLRTTYIDVTLYRDGVPLHKGRKKIYLGVKNP